MIEAFSSAKIGPWAVKKAVQWLLNRLPGYHVRWSSLEPKPETVRKSQSQTWSTDDDNLAEGIRFINKNAPECDAQNEQTYWVLTCIKPDSGTPVAGWPEVKVRAMAQNKSRGVSGAQSMTEFPLTTFSLHPVMHQHILPYLYPLLMTSAIVLLGSPGVGKTPALIVMAMAMAFTYGVSASLESSPGGDEQSRWITFVIVFPKCRKLCF